MPTIQNTMFAIRKLRSFCPGSEGALDDFFFILLIVLYVGSHFYSIYHNPS